MCICVYVYVYVYMCMCICVCVYAYVYPKNCGELFVTWVQVFEDVCLENVAELDPAVAKSF